MKGWSLYRGGEPRCCGVDLRGGAKYSDVSQAVLVCQEKLKQREAGFDGQDVGGGTHEAVSRPPLDLMPKDGELPSHVDGRYEGVGAIAQDAEEEGGG